MALFPHVAARRIAEFLGGFPHHVPVATDFVDAPILTMYWVLGCEEHDAAVSFVQLRAEADRGEDVEGGEACEACGLRTDDIEDAEFSVLGIRLYGVFPRLPRTDDVTELIGDVTVIRNCRACVGRRSIMW